MKRSPKKRNDQTVGSRTLEKGLRLLSSFIQAAEEQGLAELSQRTGLHKSIVFRLAATLVRHSFLEKDPETRRYRVGLRAFEVGSAFVLGREAEQVALPVMRQLVATCGHAAQLGVQHERDVVYTAVVPGSSVLRVSVRIGERRPAHATAMGKALLACLPEDALTKLYRGFRFPPLTPHTVRGLTRLRRALAETRERGFGFNDEESVLGLQAVAAVVRDARDRAVAALSVAYPKHLVAAEEVARLIPLVRESAATISKRLGTPGDSRDAAHPRVQGQGTTRQVGGEPPR